MSAQKNAFTTDALRIKVSNYRNFAAKEIAPEAVIMSAVFHKDEIGQLLASADAVRIYMIKDSDSDTGEDVSYMMVPVVKETNESMTEQLLDGPKSLNVNLLMARAEPCMGPLCR